MKLEFTITDVINGEYKEKVAQTKAIIKKKTRNNCIVSTLVMIAIFIPTCLLFWAFVLAPIFS